MLAIPASADVYKCKDDDGKINFTDVPCKGDIEDVSETNKGSEANLTHTRNTPVQRNGDMAQAKVDYTTYLNKLKACEPYVFTYKDPLFGVLTSKIVGKDSGRCQVISHNDLSGEFICNYSDKTISILTSEEQYKKIEKGNISAPQSPELSSRMTAECVFPY